MNTEYTCGCIVHMRLGQLRSCSGAKSNTSLSGKVIEPNPEAEAIHRKAKVLRNY